MAIYGCSDVEHIFDRFFGFLQRYTDVYHTMIEPNDYDSTFMASIKEINSKGFPPGHVRKLVSKMFDKYTFKYMSENQPYLLKCNRLRDKYTTLSNIIINESDKYVTAKLDTVKKERAREFNKIDKTTNDTKSQSASFTINSQIPTSVSKKYTNTHNGGITDNYCWSQTISDVIIEIDCKQLVSKNDVTVKISPTKLLVKTPKFKIEGTWCRNIVNDNEFNWFIQDKCVIVISVDKAEESWWDCLLKGDATIDTQQIESVKMLSDLDEKSQHFICNALSGKTEQNTANYPFIDNGLFKS